MELLPRSARRAIRRRRLEREAHGLHPAPFVVGHGRSGTTLLRLMLDAHPELAIPPETQFLPQLIQVAKEPGATADSVCDVLVGHRRWEDFGIDADEMRAAWRGLEPFDLREGVRLFYRAYAERHGKPRWGDKSPGYGWNMPPIDNLLPEARFIHLIRDGRDVTLSLLAKHENPPTPRQQAKHWIKRVAQTRRQGTRVRHYMELHYEDLLDDPERQLRRICDFSELEFDEAMLSYHERAEERIAEIRRDMKGGQELTQDRSRGEVSAERRVEIHKLTSEPPRKDRIGKWRREMDPADLAEFEAVAAPLLTELGYELGGDRRP
ncbi:MAG: sulfotransferase family protein [Solirubrobacterales bacterium]